MNSRTLIKEELSHISQKIMEVSERNPFFLQDGYFEELPEKIMASIRSENMSAQGEIMQLSPVLAGLKEKETYRIDKDYFGQQNAELFHSHDKKVIQIKNWRRLAMAASLTGILGLGTILYSQYGKSHDVISSGLAIKTEAQFNQKLSELNSEDIMKYLKQYASAYDQHEMEYMIDPNHLPDEKEYFSDPTLNELMKEVNDADINM
jgi:hypothetical protein